jgi:deoxyribonuclease IV
MEKQQILLGAHTSMAGGLENALFEGESIGATTIQLFTSNQRQWYAKTLSQEAIHKFEEALVKTKLSHIMSHDSYLINLGAPNHEVLVKSRQAFRDEILRCLQLGISYCNFHPGSALDAGTERCLDLIVESLRAVQDLFTGKEPLRLLIETTAGQGSTVGASFEEIAYLVERTKEFVPIGVCIDTCHIFAAGYDIRTKEALSDTLKKFDDVIGLEHLYAFHLNDSMKELGSRVDRHAPLGQGCIGIECFQAIMQDPRLKALPKYLETPGGPANWKQEIALLRSFV